MRQAALYARVSTRRQEQEATIESQLDRLLSYAQQHEYELPADLQFVDQAVSGQRLARPGLDRLRDAAAAGAFATLLCLSPDRLARNLGAQQVVLDELRRAAVTVIFLDQPSLGDSPQAKLLLDIQGAFAEYERVLISDRMRRGRLYHLRQGQAVPYPAPYGYRYQPAQGQQTARWLPEPTEAAVVEQAFVWYTQDSLRLGALAQRLNQRHVPGPDGATWHVSTLGRLLRQSAYRGLAYYNRRQTDASGLGERRRQGQGRLRFPRYTMRPATEWIPCAVPALVSDELWQAAQERLVLQSRFAPRNSQHTYLLRGLLVCSVCGHTLQGRTQRGVGYYTCVYGGAQRPPDVPPHTRWLRCDVVEPLIWQALAALLREPQRIHDAWAALQTTPAVTTGDTRRQHLLQQQRQRLLDAYQASALTLDELIQRQNPLDLELQELRKRLAAQPTQASAQISLEAFSERIQHALTASDDETQQEVLRLLIERIVVSDDALTVEHIIPTVSESRLHPTYHTPRITHHVSRSFLTRSAYTPRYCSGNMRAKVSISSSV
jgi:site-specific DNA recombinase